MLLSNKLLCPNDNNEIYHRKEGEEEKKKGVNQKS